MGSSPQPPAVTDPNITAANQQTLNTNAGQSSQAGSMVNQVNPYGNLSYAQTGTSANGTPLYTATTSLSPAQQQLLTELTGTQTTAGKQAGTLLKNANYGANPTDVIGNGTTGLTGAAVAQQTAYLNPYFQTQTSQLDTQLRNQGFAPGQPGYDNAMRALQNNQNNTVTGFISQIEPQMFQQATQEYQMPAQMAESLAQFGAPTNPTQSFTSTPSLNITPANLTQATANAQQAQQQTYQDQLAQNNAMMSGLFGVGSAVLGGWAKNGGVQNMLGAAALA
jgi:hypothetical protein